VETSVALPEDKSILKIFPAYPKVVIFSLL